MPGPLRLARHSLPGTAGASRPHGHSPSSRAQLFPSAGSGGQEHPRQGTEPSAAAARDHSRDQSRRFLRARGAPGALPAAATAPPQSPAAAPKRGQKKKVLRGPPRPRKGAEAARRGQPAVPSGIAAPQPPKPPRAPHPYSPRHGMPGTAAPGRSALRRGGPGPALAPPPPGPAHRRSAHGHGHRGAVSALRCRRRLCAAC